VLDGNGNTIALMKESWVADRGQGLAHENREFYAPTGDNVLLGRVEMDWKNSADANHAEETITVTRNPAQPITL
jgi:hypothetical protein